MTWSRGAPWLTAGLLGLVACGDTDPAELSRKTIGPEGGLVSSHDRVLTLVFQPGALSRDTEIEVFPSDEPPPIFGPAYRVRPDIELELDVEVTYRRVLPSNPNAAAVAAIRLDDYTEEMGHWRPLTRLRVDPEQRSVIAIDDALSLYYGLIEIGGAPPLPTGDTDDGTTGGTGPGPSETTTGGVATEGTTFGSTSDGTTMGVMPGTTTDTPGTTTDTPGTTTGTPGTTTDAPGTTTDTGMVMPLCGDGMPVAGELCVLAAVAYGAGLGPIDLGLGDLDGGGALDVVTLDLATLQVSVLAGNGDGTFGAPGPGEAAGTGPVALELGDFTGDGALDAAVLDPATDSVLVLAGDGLGALTVGVPTVVPVGAVGFAGANLDGGASRDLTVLGATGDVAQILLGGGVGLLPGAAAMLAADRDAAIAHGSFNPGADMIPDIITVGPAGYHAFATDGAGTGFLGDVPGAFGGGGTFIALRSDDIDGDGNDDVVGLDVVGEAIVVGISTGGPASFGFLVPVAVGTAPSDVALADLDGDGDLDAVVSNAGSDDVTVLTWNGAAYVVALTQPVGTGPSAVAVGDVDGDGVVDIVTANEGSDDVSVLLSDP